jgi:hypothetical protein
MEIPKTSYYVTINSKLRHHPTLSLEAKVIGFELIGMEEDRITVVSDPELHLLTNIPIEKITPALDDLARAEFITLSYLGTGFREIYLLDEAF